MKLELYTSNTYQEESNCVYPNKAVVTTPEELAEAISHDHVAAKYTGDYRGNKNFESSVVCAMDCDNSHSENPQDWIFPEMLAENTELSDVSFAAVPSRNHMKPKNGKAARPRYHFFFECQKYTDYQEYARLKEQIQKRYSFFDGGALDAGRFFYASRVSAGDIVWNEGWLTIEDVLEDALVQTAENTDMPSYGTIAEGSRNNTMSHFAGRVLKKLGNTQAARDAFDEQAKKCTPPLENSELNKIWNSAVHFFERSIVTSKDYIPPEEYNNDFGSGFLKPEDYSDIGEAKVLAKDTGERLRFTNATDFIVYQNNRWYEDKQKAVAVAEDFMDRQLQDAEEAIHIAEEALIAIGVSESDVKGRTKDLPKLVPGNKMSLLYALLGADAYKKFVMKYRNYKNLINALSAARPMVAIDISELDYDAELLNTPAGTCDLTKGIAGMRPHDPDDLITKITGCAPSESGRQLWQEALDRFFCGDNELIAYVQEIVGMAAIGKVYAEHMVIAYGGGANGKSTFWNTIARVLGNYSGKISAEALTMNCKRNVKPEMAELKGKRLIIASEMEEGMRLNTATVKQLCSTDEIQAEKKYKDPFSFIPSHTLVLYTNHLPKVGANDDGIWRRLVVIPFNAKITGNSDVKNYADYLFDNAGGYVLGWIMEGAKKAIDQEFKIREPKIVKDAIESYRQDNDWLGQFIEECCEVDKAYEAKSGELYQTYRSRCNLNGEYVRSTADFYSALEKAGFFKQRKNTGRMIRGLRLKEGQDFLD